MNNSDWDDDDSEWLPDESLTLLQAVDTITSTTNVGYREAKASLLEMIADSRLELRCAQIREEADIGDVDWKRSAKIKVHAGQKVRGFRFDAKQPEVGMPLRQNFFGRNANWTIDQDRVGWETGILVATTPSDLSDRGKLGKTVLVTRRVALGLRVRKSGTLVAGYNPPVPLSITGENSTGADQTASVSPIMVFSAAGNSNVTDGVRNASAPSALPPNKPGRKRDTSWDDWIAEVVVYTQIKDLDPDISVKAFHKIITERLHERNRESPDQGTIEKAFSAIKKRWRQAKEDREI